MKEMTKEDLVAKKLQVDIELSKLKMDIDEAKRNARAKGKYLPPAVFREMEEKRFSIARRSQQLQMAISEINANRRQEALREMEQRARDRAENGGRSRSALFMEAAERVLNAELFDRILDEAGL